MGFVIASSQTPVESRISLMVCCLRRPQVMSAAIWMMERRPTVRDNVVTNYGEVHCCLVACGDLLLFHHTAPTSHRLTSTKRTESRRHDAAAPLMNYNVLHRF